MEQDDNQILAYLESERFYNPSDEPQDLEKSNKEKGIINWNPIKIEDNLRFLSGDIEVYRILQKSVKESNTVYDAEFDGKQHLSTKVVMLNKGGLFLKEAKQKAAENEGFVYGLAKMAGLSEFMEPTCSVKIGESYYSCSNMMEPKFKSLSTWKRENPEALNGFLSRMADTGTLHKLAAFHYVIKDLDKNRGNCFSDGESLRVIDHGRSFNSNGYVFTPGYLRDSENQIIKSGSEDNVRLWLGGIKADRRLFLLHAYLDKLDMSYKSSVCNQIAKRWEDLAATNPVRGPAVK